MNIRSKLVLCNLITALVPTAVVSYVIVIESLAEARLEFVANARQKMHLVDTNYETFLDDVRSGIAQLAESDRLRRADVKLSNYMSAAPRLSDAAAIGGADAEIERYFDDYARHRPHLADVYMGTDDGGFVALGDLIMSNYDPRTRPWYVDAVAAPDTVVVTRPYVSTTSETMISVAKAVLRPDGGVHGVVSVDVTLKKLTALIARAHVGRTGYMILVDSGGTILADPRNQDNLFRNVADAEGPLYESLATSAEASFSFGSGTDAREVSTYVSPRSGWKFVTVIDRAETLESAYFLIDRLLLAAVFVVLVFVAIGFLLGDRITRPVTSVTESLRRIAEGDTDLGKELDDASHDETGALAKWFNRFLEAEKNKRSDLLRAHKLEAVGELAAGIAHEINTPAQFVGDNVAYLERCFRDLLRLLESYETLLKNVPDDAATSARIDEIRKLTDEIDLEFLREDMPDSFQQASDGVARIGKIVCAIKEFTHSGCGQIEAVDLNRSIENTVTVAQHEWRYCATLDLKLDPNLRPVNCFADELNQTILNLVVNAAHAIDAKRLEAGTIELGVITITTRQADDYAVVAISDTGIGIVEENLERIFNPFFTTKEVGEGTGQGLAIAFKSIVDRHGGKLEVSSEVGRGSTFTISLPVTAAANDAEAPPELAAVPAGA